MSDTTNESVSTAEEDLEMLPSGWADGDDFFNPDSWSGSEQTDASVAETDSQEQGNADGYSEENGGPTTAEVTEETDSPEGGVKPTTQNEPTGKYKFKAVVDHNEQDVELDPADLPNVWQKAQALDRAQAKLGKMSPLLDQAERTAKLLGYDSAEEMLKAASDSYRDGEIEKLVEEGTPRSIAEDYIDRKMGGTPEKKPEGEVPQRDFKPEAELLLQMWPELKGQKIPDEVLHNAVNKGMPLVAAYKAYVDKQKKADSDAENKALKKDNKILKQNAEAASRAPVRGVARGGANEAKDSVEDPFLKGFLSI